MKKIHIHEEYCISCRLCEINCLVKHSRSGKIIKAFREENPRPLTRVKVEEEGYLSFALGVAIVMMPSVWKIVLLEL